MGSWVAMKKNILFSGCNAHSLFFSIKHYKLKGLLCVGTLQTHYPCSFIRANI